MAERLTVEVIICTTFLNRHIVAILCTEQWIHFRGGEITIVKKLIGRSQGESSPFVVSEWTKKAVRKSESDTGTTTTRDAAPKAGKGVTE